ncbi:PREDICTED: colorectal cancer-associated protein 2 [Chaetura pelagica]|uniref:colorectal cancer-associated protein 2 n=1 Tax=Chaetura pelagica TaxID=8897 RepID=UPI0005238F6F|nr:PREDICTED: colorectal cancer-associated protein 2 [Chaetura pelagica]
MGALCFLKACSSALAGAEQALLWHLWLHSVSPHLLSGKPKVYQGVRVKITVKELLQQRRARQAATAATATPFDAEPISSVPNYCPSWQFSNCLSCEESPGYLEQLVESCLQPDAALDPAFSTFQTSSHYTSDAFQPVPLCFNQGLAPGSPSSAELSSPLNHSCSPPQLSPFTPLTHSPPSALDTKTYGCPGEEWSCHAPSPYPQPPCCCTACGSQHGDNRVPQYFPSTDCMDYLPPMAMAEDFFRRDRNCDICYS